MYSLLRAMQKMGQMFEQTEIIDKDFKEEIKTGKSIAKRALV